MTAREIELTPVERRLLNDYQRDLPLDPRPFARIADELGVTEDAVLESLARLKASGAVTRVGPVFAPNRVGVSMLAAIAVPPAELTRVAALVSRFPEVNHNYERDHRFNLWFVVTASSPPRLEEVASEIESRTGFDVLRLPMLEDYYIDLGFPIEWREVDA
ncbi:MAG: Lrp/AsnC family transcriptional regulator [Proteobacteria bacterium]|nr:MAG: Lrp/AsnC family transcriptional regulator [Pseudomonadota bacterium]